MNHILNNATRFLKSNSPALLSAGAIVGTVTTAYLSGRASFKAAHILAEDVDPYATTKEKAQIVWKEYIPTGISCVVTVACIVSSTKVNTRRVLAATMAYSITEQAFSQYKEKVVEQLGENKERAIRDQIADDNIKKNPAAQSIVISSGKILCCEAYTGRYFESDMETLRSAMNKLNERLLREDRCSLDDFYYLIRLPATMYSADLGWYADKIMELTFSSALTEDGRPCLSFEYNYVKPLYVYKEFFS